jgi:hypothetical protein
VQGYDLVMSTRTKVRTLRPYLKGAGKLLDFANVQARGRREPLVMPTRKWLTMEAGQHVIYRVGAQRYLITGSSDGRLTVDIKGSEV